MSRITRIVALLLLVLGGALAQSDAPEQGNPAFTQAELDQMLAPIALYPDELLSQMLMAATYPLEVVEAARWSRGHPDLKGEAAVAAVAAQDWDESVKSLVAFPQVLETMDQKLQWTVRLGDAFLAQQAQVMDTVQGLRQKAAQSGNLNSNTMLDVRREDEAIEIEPVNPEIVYVPYYDPTVVYGPWWWPAYPPVYWDVWPGYAWYGAYGWGIGIGVGVGFFYGGWDWSHHHAYRHDHHDGHGHDGRGHPGDHRGYAGQGEPWRHDPEHRHSVPYRNESLNREFGRTGAHSDARREFRGYGSPAGAHQYSQREASVPHTGQAPTRSHAAPQAPGSAAPPHAGQPPSRSYGSAPYGAGTRSAPMPDMKGRAPGQTKPHAFEGIGRGPEVRGYSSRGHQSVQSMPARQAPAQQPRSQPQQRPHR